MELKLSVNGYDVLMGYDDYAKLIRQVLDCEENKNFFNEVSKSESYQIRLAVAGKSNLHDETINRLLNDQSQEVVAEISQGLKVNKFLTSNIIDDMFLTLNFSALENIIRVFDTIEIETVKSVLFDRIMEMKDPILRHILAQSTTNKSFLNLLSRDCEPSVSYEAKSQITKLRYEKNLTEKY
ncbi:MAG: hypothetical protein NT007_00290 [Candidatus Kapabacteria bacterium]|nr:hypothetical protein [Candidatus Kapabacteria bacterium]